jgi:hypothetical protein
MLGIEAESHYCRAVKQSIAPSMIRTCPGRGGIVRSREWETPLAVFGRCRCYGHAVSGDVKETLLSLGYECKLICLVEI